MKDWRPRPTTAREGELPLSPRERFILARLDGRLSVAELSTYDTGRVRKLLDDAIQSALTGKSEPKAALGEAQGQAERLLKRYQ